MTDTTGTGTVPEPQGAALLQKPGDLMRSKREAAGMTQAQVGEALHLTMHYIKSLENDEYGKLPGLTFVKGYFRAYARLLKLDEAAVLACYDSYVRSLGLQESTQEQTLRVRRRNDQAILWAVVAGVILVIGLGSGWWFFGRQDAAAPATVVATLPRNTSTTPPPAQQVQELQTNTQAGTAASTLAVPPQTRVVESATTATLTDALGDEAPVAAGIPANGTMLMTEDGPVVVTDATVAGEVPAADLGAAAAAAVEIPAVVDGTTAVPALQQAPDAPADAAAAPVAAAVASTSTGTNTRRVELVGTGADQLELQFAGNSWVEVDDAARVRLYSDMMRNGDALSIKAAAPFHILLGDATGVSVLLNGQPLPIAASIRSDKTARIMISAEGVSAWAVE